MFTSRHKTGPAHGTTRGVLNRLNAFAMSSRGGPPARFNGVRDTPQYDQVPVGSLRRDEDPLPLQHQGGSELALSYDPLPPPPLPDCPPVGPEFDPSGSEDNLDAIDIKPVHRFIPDSWKNFFRASDRSSKTGSMPGSDGNNKASGSSGGVRCSPPHSPKVPGSYRDPYGGSGGSYTSRKEQEAMLLRYPPDSFDGQTVRTAMTYSERVEDYHLRYAYMKSWAGLLRILGCVELLMGAAVFACVCAYVHKDNEWHNMFGYSQPQMYGGLMGSGMSGASSTYYTGPKTPFVLVVAGLAWVVTVILLVLGMTMYYRTILLDSNWWPLTEFVINLVLAVLYMAAAIVYVNDTTRGGLCFYPVFNNGLNGAFCRTEAGQTAAIIFLFATMLLYLIGGIVSLKMWRHEAKRRYRESLGQEMKMTDSLAPRSLIVAGSKAAEPVQVRPVAVEIQPEVLRGHIPSGHIPKPVIMADYIAKYPSIRTDEEKDRYKAVFKDQYAEYKELHVEVQAVLKKFDEMDGMMRSLPQLPTSQMEFDRINKILQEYQRKKTDPTFLEKKERCEYLKSKLSHIKQKIQEYDKVMEWNDGYG